MSAAGDFHGRFHVGAFGCGTDPSLHVPWQGGRGGTARDALMSETGEGVVMANNGHMAPKAMGLDFST